MLPRLYAILDTSSFADTGAMFTACEELAAGGVTLLQYRNKSGNARQMLDQGRELKRLLGSRVQLIMNDRVDLCLAAGWDGVHVGQDDLPPASVRSLLGPTLMGPSLIGPTGIGPTLWMGVSTHTPQQLAEADLTSADYLAIGPVFSTSSKANPDAVVGLEGVRRARALTRKPLVAIGGITRANARQAIEAGADSVAVIADLLDDPRRAAAEFLALF